MYDNKKGENVMVKLKDKMRWTYFADMLEDEYTACRYEGKPVDKFQKYIEEIHKINDSNKRERKAGRLLEQMEKEIAEDTGNFEEPSEYDEIQAVLPKKKKRQVQIDNNEIKERLLGAWVGRITGCLLGIPVEGWTKVRIQGFLSESGQYPLKTFMTADVRDEVKKKYKVKTIDPETPYDRTVMCWKENIDKYPVDDDMNYPVLALKIAERYGLEFDAQDVAEAWLLSMPGLHACTAERAAYRNLMNGILPPESARYRNPYREWLGAQIRGDFWGYVFPGDSKCAAKRAYIDASVSHDKNGIYGEMLISSICSLCYRKNLTMKEIIEEALLEIPEKCRLALCARTVLEEYEQKIPFYSIVNRIHKEYNENIFFDWCYVMPNIQLVIAAILYFSESFTEAITNTVMCGFDTDCNGATVGSIVGLYRGISCIDRKWYEDIQPIVCTSIHGYYEMGIEELVERTYRLIKF